VEAQLQNKHIDPNYFLKGGQSDVAQQSTRMASQSAPEHPDMRNKSVRMPVAGAGPAAGSGPDTQKLRKPALSASSAGVSSRGSASEGQGRVKKGLHTRFYVIGLFLSLLLLGATVLIPVKKEPAAPTSQFVQLVNQNEIKSPEPIPERRPAQPAPPEGKPAVVTVPSTGLRTSHSMESRIIPKVTVRQKEHVEIIRRFSSQTGPDWIQLRTKSGTIGWVVASVVKELRG
jgi:hypothetical protein